jgi:hypothetical protein
MMELRSFAGVYPEHSRRAQESFGLTEEVKMKELLQPAKLFFAETSLLENLAEVPVGSVPGCIAT